MTTVAEQVKDLGKTRTLSSDEIRQARIQLATRFLDNVLLPRARSGELIKSDIIPQYRVFTRTHRQPGSDFELQHVWNVAWSRQLVNECREENNAIGVVPDADALALVLRLLDDVS